MNASVKNEYKRLRKNGWRAANALRNAKVKDQFEDLEYCEVVRLSIVADEYACLEDLKGDCFNPDVNDDIPASRLAKEEKEFEERAEMDGIWGIVGEYRCPCCGEWTQTDSVWGFVGDDWKDSGYDTDIMAETIDAYNNCLEKDSHAPAFAN